MAFNPLQNYLGGQQAGQQQQANTLAGRLAGQAQNPEFKIGQSTDFRQLMAIDPDRANKAMSTFQSLSESRKKAYFDDMVTGKAMLDAGDLSGFGKFQENRLQNLKRLGSDDVTGTEMVIDKFNQGDIAGLQQGYAAGIDAGRQLGYIKPDARQGAKKAPFQRGEGGLVFDPNTGSYSVDPVAKQSSIDRAEMTSLEKAQEKVEFEFRKEERQVAKTAVVDFNKRASEIRSSYEKINSILGSGKLNRMKIASAMTSMARLLSPGIVTNQDFENLSNSSNPIASVIATLNGKGDDGKGIAENLQRFVDPTNPDLFDKDSFLSTAMNVAGAEIPALLDVFNDAKGRAGRAGVSERALDTNFGQNKNFEYLSGMLEQNKPVMNHSKLGSVTEGQIQETMKNKGMTREQVLALLQGAN